MPSNNTTEKTQEIMGQITAAAKQLAIAFGQAEARLYDEPDRSILFKEAHCSLREMQLALVKVAAGMGPKFTFEPNDHAFRICLWCTKPLAAHIGRDCNCPVE